jgi:hypothetical protein
MPLGLVALAIAAGIAYMRSREAHAAPALPGPAAYMPPIAAPDWARMAYAQAAASRDPIIMVQTAQLLQQRGQTELAQALSAQYQQLTNQPIPGVGWGAGGWAPPGGPADPRMRQALALLQLARRERARRQAVQVAGYLRALQLARTA